MKKLYSGEIYFGLDEVAPCTKWIIFEFIAGGWLFWVKGAQRDTLPNGK